MLNSRELDQELDKLISGDTVDESDQLISVASDIASFKKIKIDEKRFLDLKNQFIRAAGTIAESKKSRETVQLTARPKRMYFISIRRVAAAALVLLMSSGTTVYAATGSMPESQLYSVKRATETAIMYLAPAAFESGLEKKFSNERIREIEHILSKRKTAANENIVSELKMDLKAYKKAVLDNKSLKEQIKKLDIKIDSKFNKNSKPNELKNDDVGAEKEIEKQNSGAGKGKRNSPGNSKKP